MLINNSHFSGIEQCYILNWNLFPFKYLKFGTPNFNSKWALFVIPYQFEI